MEEGRAKQYMGAEQRTFLQRGPLVGCLRFSCQQVTHTSKVKWVSGINKWELRHRPWRNSKCAVLVCLCWQECTPWSCHHHQPIGPFPTLSNGLGHNDVWLQWISFVSQSLDYIGWWWGWRVVARDLHWCSASFSELVVYSVGLLNTIQQRLHMKGSKWDIHPLNLSFFTLPHFAFNINFFCRPYFIKITLSCVILRIVWLMLV